MNYQLVDARKNPINSEWNRPPYRGFQYPNFQELHTAAMQYRAHGERVYVIKSTQSDNYQRFIGQTFNSIVNGMDMQFTIKEFNGVNFKCENANGVQYINVKTVLHLFTDMNTVNI